jgi:hypothetical protein
MNKRIAFAILMVILAMSVCSSSTITGKWLEGWDKDGSGEVDENEVEFWLQHCAASCEDLRVDYDSYYDCEIGDKAYVSASVGDMWNVDCPDEGTILNK